MGDMRNILFAAIAALLLIPFDASARPSRRSILLDGEEQQQRTMETKLEKATNAFNAIERKVYSNPLIGIEFEYPADRWSISAYPHGDSEGLSTKYVFGNHIYAKTSHPSEARISIAHRLIHDPFDNDLQKVAERERREATTVYEKLHWDTIREVQVHSESETEFQGNVAYKVQYSGIWQSQRLRMISLYVVKDDKLYKVKYRAIDEDFDANLSHFYHLLDTLYLGSPSSGPIYEKPDTIRPAEDIDGEENEFSDVSSSDEYYDAVLYLRGRDIVGGYDDGSYRPKNTINRAEFTKIMTSPPLVDAGDLDSCITNHVDLDSSHVFFSDVPRDSWFAAHVCMAKVSGLIEGYSDGTFQPSSEIAFVEAAKIIVSHFFGDVGTDPVWYVPYVSRLDLQKAIPISVHRFAQRISRGEMAQIIYRLHAKVQGESAHMEDIK